jgi:hypothetical protein
MQLNPNYMYRGIFKPKTKKKLYPEAKELIGKELFFVPIQQVESGKYKGCWALRCNTSSFLFLDRDIEFLEEIREPLQEN